ncbi:MAG: winged helix-turn-helix domain-containing protein [Pyrinomonadaceae bacterium]
MNTRSNRFYEFGPFRLEASNHLLLRAGEPLPLPPKAIDLLVLLVESRGNVLSRDDLIIRLWPDTFVEENNLSYNISVLRKALGEGSNGERYIATVPKRGYRFVAPVAAVVDEDVDLVGPLQTKSHLRNQGLHPDRRMLAIALAALGVIIAVAVFGVYKFVDRNATEEDPRTASAAPPTGALRTTQITASKGIDVDPAFSPDGSHIAYSSNRSGKFELYIKSLSAGGREVQITDDGEENIQPAWSSDGRLIAYHSRNRQGLWVMPAFGGVTKQLTEFGSNPAWSPVGTLIAFQSSSRPSVIWVIDINGDPPRQVTRPGAQVGKNITPAAGHVFPSWSHDGHRIAFHTDEASSQLWAVTVGGDTLISISNSLPFTSPPRMYPVFSPDGKGVYFSGGNVLWRALLDANGEATGEHFQLADLGGVTMSHLAISRDGNRIAYSAQSMSGNLWSVSTSSDAAESGEQPVPLTDDVNVVNTQPAFSPDAQQIAFRKFVRGPAAGSEIWLMDVQGKNQKQLTDIPKFALLQPEWFSTGDYIAFRSNIQGHYSVWAVPSKGGKEKLLVDVGRSLEYARLSPNGKEIAFHHPDDGILNIWVAPVGGGEPRQLTFDRGSMAYPAWSPDGAWLAFQVQRGNDTHIFIMPSSGGEPQQLTFDAGESSPYSWSPDGDKIAFTGYRNGKWDLWWVSRSTKEQKRLTNYASSGLSGVSTPVWSPLGDRIVYAHTETTGNIWIMELR